MEAYKAILESLAEAESILFYQTDDPFHGDKIKEMQQTIKAMIKDFNILTGATLN